MSNVFEYKNDLSQLSFSPEQKEAMTQRLLQAQAAQPKQENQPKRRRGLRRGAVAAVAAAACLTMAASATGVLALPSDVFAPVFGSAETEIIDRIGHPIDASATSGGVTITADAVLGDKYHYAVAYTIAKNDGTAFAVEDLNALTFDRSGTDFDLRTDGGVIGCAYFYDADPSDNAIQYVELLTTTEELPQDITVRAHFKNLRSMANTAPGEAPELLVRGNWSFSFRLQYEDLSTTMALNAPVSFDGHAVTLDDFTISPVGWRLTYTFANAVPYPEQESGQESSETEDWAELVFGSAVVELHLKDGSTLRYADAGGGCVVDDQNVMRCDKGTTFDEIIPLEDMESVTIGGVTFPIEAN